MNGGIVHVIEANEHNSQVNSSLNCFDKAWGLYESELRAFLIQRTANPVEAEDLLQTVFLKAIQQGKKFCDMENQRAWLYEVARNALIDYHRRSRIHEELPDQLPVTEHQEEAVEALSECLPRTLSELSDADREVITRCDLEGMPQAEFAAMKGIGLSAAKSRLQRARKRLKDTLRNNCRISFDATGNVCCFVPRPSLK